MDMSRKRLSVKSENGRNDTKRIKINALPLYLKWIEERFPKPPIPVQFRAGVPICGGRPAVCI